MAERLKAAGLRTEVDLRSEKIGYKIREAQVQKVPYMLVIGDKEAEAARCRFVPAGKGIVGVQSVDDFLARALREVAEKVIW